MDMKNIKVQVYMAKTQEEYDRALEWVKEQDIEDIKEVGEMPTTDLCSQDQIKQWLN